MNASDPQRTPQAHPVKLTLTDAAFGYGRDAVIRNLDATFRAGVITAILGNNGVGKSTLLKGILALTPCLGGSVRLDGTEVGSLPAAVRARKLAYLEQQASCHWPMSVARVVALGRAPHGEHRHSLLDHAPHGERDHFQRDGAPHLENGSAPIDCAPQEAQDPVPLARPSGAAETIQRKSRQTAPDPVLTAMTITDTARLADRPVTRLSGGERARVMLARALATDAPVLLADEPVAGLDPRHQLSVLEHLQQWAASGRIVIVTLHDLNLALRYCEDTLLLGTDSTACFGRSADILTPDTIRGVFGVEVRAVTVDGRTTLVNWAIAPSASGR